jgi:hypothetical protein
MALAKDLLDRGESAAVLEYLKQSGEFWHAHRGKLAEWTALIRAGQDERHRAERAGVRVGAGAP